MRLKLLDGRARLDDPSSLAGVQRLLIRAGRRSLKTFARPILTVARTLGIRRLPRGAVHAEHVLARIGKDNRLRGRRVDLAEARRPLEQLGVGDPCPEPQPVATSVSMLDGRSGTFTMSNNLVVDDRRRVIFPLDADDDGRPFRFNDLRASWTPLDEPHHVAGSVAYLSNTGVRNFGHWLLFVFPLIQHYRDYLGEDPDYYYLGAPDESWHYDSLAALGIGPERVLTGAVTGDRMLAAIADNPIPPPTSFLDFSTDTLRRPRDEAKPGKRIFISRRLRPTRPFLNEGECLERLERHGFESVCTETLTLQEERELFANADVVVGVHGAGLTNLLFCHPGCAVVELFPYGYPSPWFVEVSAVRRLTYSNLRGLPTGAKGLRPMHNHLHIDPERLDTVVAAACAAAERRHAEAWS